VRRAGAAFLAGAAILYLLSLRAYYVGFFNDDAFYVIGARSLAQGRYAELNAPGEPPLVNYLPGYPLLLAPLAWLFPGSLLPFQLLSLALILASLWLFWKCFEEELSPTELAGASLVWALSPLTVSLSGTVLSELPLLFASLLFFVLLRRAWRSDARLPWIWICALAGFACLLRPSGLALPAGLALALALEKRRRLAALVAGSSLLFLGPFLVRNYLATGQGLMYAVELIAPFRGPSTLAALAASLQDNLAYYLRFLFVTSLFRWPLAAPWLEAATVGAGLVAVWVGLRRQAGGWERSLALWLLLYLGIHLIWSKQAGRYLLPVLPFLAGCLFKGLGSWDLRLGLRGRGLWTAAALSLILSAVPVTRVVRASLFGSTPMNTPPLRAFAWVRAHARPSDVFAAELDGRFYLHTGRKVAHLGRIFEPGAFRAWLASRGVGYVAVLPTEFVMRTRTGKGLNDPMPLADLRRLLLDRRFYELVFEDEAEGSAVYRVKPRVTEPSQAGSGPRAPGSGSSGRRPRTPAPGPRPPWKSRSA